MVRRFRQVGGSVGAFAPSFSEKAPFAAGRLSLREARNQ